MGPAANNSQSGLDGNDTLLGAAGIDTFANGNDADQFVFNSMQAGRLTGSITAFPTATTASTPSGHKAISHACAAWSLASTTTSARATCTSV
jgi:hypothetical protein